MTQLLILTAIFVIGAFIGMVFLEGSFLKILLHGLGLVIWAHLTYYWWVWPLLDKICKK